jgi:hypothetical protein
MSSITEALQAGKTHHLAGRLPEAETIYQEILKAKSSKTPSPTEHRHSTHRGQCVQILHAPTTVKRGQRFNLKLENKQRYFHFAAHAA